MAPVSIPPPKMVSNPVEPVVICTNSDRLEWISVAVVNPIGTILHASRRISLVDSHRIMNTPPSARILSAFCSLMPLIVHRVFLGVNATASTVWKPASESFLVSCAEIPASYSFDFFSVSLRDKHDRGRWRRTWSLATRRGASDSKSSSSASSPCWLTNGSCSCSRDIVPTRCCCECVVWLEERKKSKKVGHAHKTCAAVDWT